MIPITTNEPMSICSKCKEQQPSFAHHSYCIKCTREQGLIPATSSFQSNDDEASRDSLQPALPTNIMTLRMRPRRWEESPEIQAAVILSSFREEGNEITEEPFDVFTPKVNTPTTAFMTPFLQPSQVSSSPPPNKRANRNMIISFGFSSPSSPSPFSSSSSRSTILTSSPISPRLLLPEL